jgi:hypothetical protein
MTHAMLVWLTTVMSRMERPSVDLKQSFGIIMVIVLIDGAKFAEWGGDKKTSDGCIGQIIVI